MPNWALVKVQIPAKVINLRHNKIYKNALLVIRYGVTYLDLRDTCADNYDA